MKKKEPTLFQVRRPHPNSDDLVFKETERCVLRMLVDSGGELFDKFNLPMDAFGVPGIRKSAMAAYSLYSRGERVDQLTIAAELGPELSEFGGMPELSNYLNINAPIVAFDSYKKQLSDMLMLRRAREIGFCIQEQASSRKYTAEQVLASAMEKAASVNPDSDGDNMLLPTIEKIKKNLSRMEAGETMSGVPTGMMWLDKQIGGLCEGGYYAIGGRPGSGKTALMEQMIAYILNSTDHGIAVFEKDMVLEKFLGRMAARICQIPFWRYNKFRLDAFEIKKFRACLDTLASLNIILADPTRLTGDTLCAKIRKYHRSHKIKAAFVDHMQILDVGEEMREGLTKASMNLRRTASDTGVAVVAIAQLNRLGGKGRPGMECIKEFDQLAADVDAMALLWRKEGEKEEDDDDLREVVCSFVKNREGPTLDIPLQFDGERMCFALMEEPKEEKA